MTSQCRRYKKTERPADVLRRVRPPPRPNAKRLQHPAPMPGIRHGGRPLGRGMIATTARTGQRGRNLTICTNAWKWPSTDLVASKDGTGGAVLQAAPTLHLRVMAMGMVAGKRGTTGAQVDMAKAVVEGARMKAAQPGLLQKRPLCCLLAPGAN